MLSIPIVLEEPQFMVVNKPAGLFSQAAPGIPSLQASLVAQLRERDAHPGNPFVGLPHRLDRATSGAVLIARNSRSLKRFGLQFQARRIGKFYLAIIEGKCEAPLTKWEDHIRKVENEARAEIVGEDAGGRLASLEAKVLAEDSRMSLLLIKLYTGRMHQIRIQAASRGVPILGDELYGSSVSFGPASGPGNGGAHEVPPLALHALRIEFRHPQSALQVSATAHPPETWFDTSNAFNDHVKQQLEDSGRDVDVTWMLDQR